MMKRLLGLLMVFVLYTPSWSITGDLDRDGDVDLDDFFLLADNFGKTGEVAPLDCGDETNQEETGPQGQTLIDLYDLFKENTDLDPDGNGYYHFPYNPKQAPAQGWAHVKYFTEIPNTRVFWTSPDSFLTYHQHQWISTPIIDNSTYSGNDGYGQQLAFVYEDFIGDTLSVYGYICGENNFGDCPSDYLAIDSLSVIIESGLQDQGP